MRLAVLKERLPGEGRVAATPDSIKKLIALGLTVAVETKAGMLASISDEDFMAAGAEIVPDAKAALTGAKILFAVQAPAAETRVLIEPGTLLVCTMNTFADPTLVPALAEAKIDGVAMEMVPRITRAQSMDVLSSQTNLSGYRAVIEAAGAFARGFPMMMTAAGTVPPARVLVIGAGVAGLQAIATARRLGGIVSGTDVRPAAKEEIKSLGAIYVGVEDDETAKQTGAYATQMSDAFRQKQAELMAATVAKNDIIICTALVQGRQAPTIVTAEMVASMRPGSIIVDLAADSGGNCAATKPGEDYVTETGVRILGHRNWPSRIAVAASQLYARNLLTFLTTFWDKDAKAPKLTPTDDIIKGVLLTSNGQVVHANFAPKAAEPIPEPAPPPAPEPAPEPTSEPAAEAPPTAGPPDLVVDEPAMDPAPPEPTITAATDTTPAEIDPAPGPASKASKKK
jgi:NAD(P) transhydrogenase subunit alpha